jgi:hypothetical protein
MLFLGFCGLMKDLMERIQKENIRFTQEVCFYLTTNLLSHIAIEPDEFVFNFLKHLKEMDYLTKKTEFESEKLLYHIHTKSIEYNDKKLSLQYFNMIFSTLLSRDSKVSRMGINMLCKKMAEISEKSSFMYLQVFGKLQVIFAKNDVVEKNVREESLLLFTQMAKYNRKVSLK